MTWSDTITSSLFLEVSSLLKGNAVKLSSLGWKNGRGCWGPTMGHLDRAGVEGHGHSVMSSQASWLLSMGKQGAAQAIRTSQACGGQ